MGQIGPESTHWGLTLQKLNGDYEFTFKNTETAVELTMNVPDVGLGHEKGEKFDRSKIEALANGLLNALETNT